MLRLVSISSRQDHPSTALPPSGHRFLHALVDRDTDTFSQVSNIEFALVEKDVVFGLQQGNAVLKQLHSEMTLENVEKLMGETSEAIAYQKVRPPRSQMIRADMCV